MRLPMFRTEEADAPAQPWPRWLLAGLLLSATWPAWLWYVRRTMDGSDEPVGLLALGALLGGLIYLQPPRGAARGLWLPSLLLLVYTGSFRLVPPVVRAALAVAAVGTLLIHGPGRAGLWMLAGLSLPLTASLQFYLGFPLRLLAASVSAWVLRMAGWSVTAEGTLLHWQGETVMVDAPCSGVHMLWFGLFTAALAAAWYGLPVWRMLGAVMAAGALVIAANILRATVLFFKEAHLVLWPAWTHEGIGVLCFLGATGLIALLCRHLEARACA